METVPIHHAVQLFSRPADPLHTYIINKTLGLAHYLAVGYSRTNSALLYYSMHISIENRKAPVVSLSAEIRREYL